MVEITHARNKNLLALQAYNLNQDTIMAVFFKFSKDELSSMTPDKFQLQYLHLLLLIPNNQSTSEKVKTK